MTIALLIFCGCVGMLGGLVAERLLRLIPPCPLVKKRNPRILRRI
ncbi:MAG: hypothetical protein QME74_01505 [Candidatus Edwardsbacteria bacterium]|nr:hypothetical protein [Candidatus Edwardsbacteria bacterium]